MGDFRLNHLTISKIVKKRNEPPEVEFGKKVYKDEISKGFSQEIVSSYFKKHSIEKSFFDEYQDGTVPRFQFNLDNYLNSTKTEEDFLVFSKNIVEILREKMANTPASVGGHLVVADIKMKYNFVFVALLNETNAFKVEGTDELFVEKILDINHLAMAGFINIDFYNFYLEDKNKVRYYISFLKGLRDVAKYFVDFLGALGGKVELKEQTQHFVRALVSYLDSLGLTDEEKEEKKYQIYKYIIDIQKNGEAVSIDTISSMISSENPSGFKEYVQDPNNNYNIDTVIDRVDTERIRKLVKFRYKDKDFSVSFKIEKYKDKIKIVKAGGKYKFVVDEPPEGLIDNLKKEGIREIPDDGKD